MTSAGRQIGTRLEIRGLRPRIQYFTLVFFGASLVLNVVRAVADDGAPWVGLVGSALLTALAAVSLLLPPRLEIDGATVALSAYGVIRRSWDLRWCGPFVLQDSHLGSLTIATTIGFRYVEPGKPPSAFGRRSLAKRRTNAGIPSQFQLPARDLAALLNERRERFATG